ncbi:MAG: hypothetical protein IPP40_09190 [bacterium]|nr:hypothetical protein [bacterium]
MNRRIRIEPFLIFLTMLPVTGVVPILKPFVMDGFGGIGVLDACVFVGEYAGGVLFAPLAGVWRTNSWQTEDVCGNGGDAGRCMLFADAAHAGLCVVDGITVCGGNISHRRAVDTVGDCGCPERKPQ